MELSIRTDVFEGPLDLLLHLIDKNKVTITDIPISLITDQYLSYIEEMESNYMEVMSEFVDMAATLISIKARMLLPQKKDENDELIDPRRELMEQLLEYKKFKLMAESLKIRQHGTDLHVFRGPSIPEEIASYRPKADVEELLKEIDFSMLYKIFQQIIKTNKDKIDPIRSQFGTIKKETFTVHEKMDEILKLKDLKKRISFTELILRQRAKSEIIATFLAILELMKTSKIRVFQVNVFHDIDIEFI